MFDDGIHDGAWRDRGTDASQPVIADNFHERHVAVSRTEDVDAFNLHSD